MRSTTIKINPQTKQTLDKMRLFERDTYNDIIERMIEDNLELNEKTKKELAEARKRIKRREFVTLEEVEKEFGL